MCKYQSFSSVEIQSSTRLFYFIFFITTMSDPEGKANHYEDFDWDELTEEVRAAATTLGYDQKLWDGDGKASSDQKDWEELTTEERKAAELLGYTEETWDDDSFCCC